MQQRLPSLLDPPLAFAHRGASAHAPENTMEAFELALRLGATGLESDVWVTADGVAVLDHDGVVRRGLRKVRLADLDHSELPEHIPTLAELAARVPADVSLSLDVKTTAAFDPTAAAVRSVGGDLAERTWLCHPDAETLSDRRHALHEFRLAHSTRLDRLGASPELHASRLASWGIDAMNMHHTDWSGGLTVMFHRFGVYAFGWDLQFEHHLSPAIKMGLDAVYSDHTDLMVDVFSREVGGPGGG